MMHKTILTLAAICTLHKFLSHVATPEDITQLRVDASLTQLPLHSHWDSDYQLSLLLSKVPLQSRKSRGSWPSLFTRSSLRPLDSLCAGHTRKSWETCGTLHVIDATLLVKAFSPLEGMTINN